MLDDASMFGLIYNIKVVFLFNEAATLQEIFFWTHLKVTLFPNGMIPCIEMNTAKFKSNLRLHRIN